MKLAISNIAWTKENDESIYTYLLQKGFQGLEIAPTRLFSDKPYEHVKEAIQFSKKIKNNYNLLIPSMQSIWYGRQEAIFGSEKERQALLDYTFQAINFAEAIGCKNLVFGCPRNRNVSGDDDYNTGIVFFRQIGNYAQAHHTVVALEANPVIYGTNFLNTTKAAIDFCRKIDNKGIGINYDLGTVIYNGEDYHTCLGNLDLINHVHISEPYLAKIEKREMHRELLKTLEAGGYDKYVSIEMRTMEHIDDVYETINYVRDLV